MFIDFYYHSSLFSFILSFILSKLYFLSFTFRFHFCLFEERLQNLVTNVLEGCSMSWSNQGKRIANLSSTRSVAMAQTYISLS